MLWHLLKYYLGFIIAAYFKRAQIKNAHYLKTKGPIIIALNHPNAFMDPVAFSALIYPPKVHYLARGDTFKKGIASLLLESLGIIPIYRMQDEGKEGLKKNDATYNKVNRLLQKNKKIIIFAEGLCIQERRLRPLKKGVPRMIFGAMQACDLKDLLVVPVGVNYQDPSQFRGTVFFNVGKPIKVIDYMESYHALPAKTMNQFIADLTVSMKALIVNIKYRRSEYVIEHLEEIYRYTYFTQHKLNLKKLENEFIFSNMVVETINLAEDNQPEEVIDLHKKTTHYFSTINKYCIKDWLIHPARLKSIHYGEFYLRLFYIIATFPIYIIGIISSYLPYKLTDYITTKKVKIKEFKSSFRMGIGAFVFLFYYIILFFIIKAMSPNFLWDVIIVSISLSAGIFCLHISPFRKKTMGIWRLLKLKANHPTLIAELGAQRLEIIKSFENLKHSMPH